MSNSQYFKEYYQKNKERISARNKAKYLEDRENPEKLSAHRERSTEYSRRYRNKNRGKVNAYSKRRHQERKYLALEIIGKGVIACVNCGCNVLDFLEINHINGGGCKEHKLVKKSLKDLVLSGQRKTDDLNIKCRVCNALDYLKRKNKNASKRYNIDFCTKNDINIEIKHNGQEYNTEITR